MKKKNQFSGHNLVTYPHHTLLRPCNWVNMDDLVMIDTVNELIERMTEVMIAEGGIGLAANQIGVDLRVAITKCNGNIKSYINPKWIGASAEEGNTIVTEEGCLSIPNKYVCVRRWNKSTFSHTPISNIEEFFELDGLESICLQHEIDHLNGITILHHRDARYDD